MPPRFATGPRPRRQLSCGKPACSTLPPTLGRLSPEPPRRTPIPQLVAVGRQRDNPQRGRNDRAVNDQRPQPRRPSGAALAQGHQFRPQDQRTRRPDTGSGCTHCGRRHLADDLTHRARRSRPRSRASQDRTKPPSYKARSALRFGVR